MIQYTKRELFGEKSKADLLPVFGESHDGLAKTVDRILALSERERLIIRADIMNNGRSTNYNKKHEHILDIANAPGNIPTQKVKSAYDVTERFRVDGYGWQRNGLQLTVPLVKVLDGTKLFAYHVSRPDWEQDIALYDAPMHSKSQGIRAVVEVSSRREKEHRHTVRLKGVPIIGDNWQQVQSAKADCEDSLFRDLAYHLPEDRKTFCAHEIAAYFLVAQYLHDGKNDTAARMSPFAFVHQELIDLYKRIDDQTQIEYRTSSGKRDRRNANEFEIEVLLTTGIAKNKVRGFSTQGKLAERRW